MRNFAVSAARRPHTGYNGEPTEPVIGDRNKIWEHVTMHIAAPAGGVTRVGDDGMYMATSRRHDCTVGDNVILAHSATLGGHVDIGDFVMVSGLAAVHQYCRVGRYSFIGGLAAVTKDVIPYGSVWGNHAHLEGLNLVGPAPQLRSETINELGRLPLAFARKVRSGADRRHRRGLRPMRAGHGDHRLRRADANRTALPAGPRGLMRSWGDHEGGGLPVEIAQHCERSAGRCS